MMENEEAIVYTVEDSIVVKASNPEVDSDVSKLSPLDRLMPPVAFHIWFFYSYSVERTELEEALQQLLNRYPELSGRLDLAAGEVKLTNEGAQLLFLEPASVSMTELKTRNFDYDLCVKHFNADTPVADEFLLKIAVQKLDNNDGMVLRFSAHHSLCDINSFYLLVADFCSQVRDKKFKFPAEEILQGQRQRFLNSSGNQPRFGHPEILLLSSKAEFDTIVRVSTQDLLSEPCKVIGFTIVETNLEQLKSDANSKSNGSLIPSTNDCLVSLLFKIFAETFTIDPDMNPDNVLTLQLGVNVRFRRSPQIPKMFLGNAILNVELDLGMHDINAKSFFDIGQQVRKGIKGMTEDYIQSCIDKIASDELAQPKCMYDLNTMRFTNWNRYFDWYSDADLGSGMPEKFGFFTKYLDRFCIIQPGRNDGDLDLIMGQKRTQMDRFTSHPDFKKYFNVWQ